MSQKKDLKITQIFAGRQTQCNIIKAATTPKRNMGSMQGKGGRERLLNFLKIKNNVLRMLSPF